MGWGLGGGGVEREIREGRRGETNRQTYRQTVRQADRSNVILVCSWAPFAPIYPTEKVAMKTEYRCATDKGHSLLTAIVQEKLKTKTKNNNSCTRKSLTSFYRHRTA